MANGNFSLGLAPSTYADVARIKAGDPQSKVKEKQQTLNRFYQSFLGQKDMQRKMQEALLEAERRARKAQKFNLGHSLISSILGTINPALGLASSAAFKKSQKDKAKASDPLKLFLAEHDKPWQKEYSEAMRGQMEDFQDAQEKQMMGDLYGDAITSFVTGGTDNLFNLNLAGPKDLLSDFTKTAGDLGDLGKDVFDKIKDLDFSKIKDLDLTPAGISKSIGGSVKDKFVDAADSTISTITDNITSKAVESGAVKEYSPKKNILQALLGHEGEDKFGSPATRIFDLMGMPSGPPENLKKVTRGVDKALNKPMINYLAKVLGPEAFKQRFGSEISMTAPQFNTKFRNPYYGGY